MILENLLCFLPCIHISNYRFITSCICQDRHEYRFLVLQNTHNIKIANLHSIFVRSILHLLHRIYFKTDPPRNSNFRTSAVTRLFFAKKVPFAIFPKITYDDFTTQKIIFWEGQCCSASVCFLNNLRIHSFSQTFFSVSVSLFVHLCPVDHSIIIFF